MSTTTPITPTASENTSEGRFTPLDLPTPAEHPEADIVIYDGECKFCLGQVRNLLKFDGRQRLAFMSLHDPEVTRRYPDLTHDQMMEQMYVVATDGRKYGGAAAIRYLSRRLPRLWVLAPLTHIPFTMPIQQWVYKQVAKRRYQIAGRNAGEGGEGGCDSGACAIHYGDVKKQK